jgi:hypothetical protein
VQRVGQFAVPRDAVHQPWRPLRIAAGRRSVLMQVPVARSFWESERMVPAQSAICGGPRCHHPARPLPCAADLGLFAAAAAAQRLGPVKAMRAGHISQPRTPPALCNCSDPPPAAKACAGTVSGQVWRTPTSIRWEADT